MKVFRIVSLLLVVSLFIGMVGYAGAQEPTVKMAIVAPMTGDVSTFGAVHEERGRDGLQ